MSTQKRSRSLADLETAIMKTAMEQAKDNFYSAAKLVGLTRRQLAYVSKSLRGKACRSPLHDGSRPVKERTTECYDSSMDAATQHCPTGLAADHRCRMATNPSLRGSLSPRSSGGTPRISPSSFPASLPSSEARRALRRRKPRAAPQSPVRA